MKNTEKETKQNIDNYIKEVIDVNEIPGLALAVVKNGEVIYEGYYGKTSLEENTPVDQNSIFRIYSTTKLISTVGVFQLIEKGKLSLEDVISKYIDNLPKEWQEIKIKNLLSHSSGLPDVVRFQDIPNTLSDEEKIGRLSKKPMDFETGKRFRYNQTNYWLLTQIVEKITGLTFDEYILNNQFPSSGKSVFFSSNSVDTIPSRVSKYDFDSKTKKYVKPIINDGVRAHSGNGLNITLQEFIRWNERLDENLLMKKETKYSMWKPFEFKNSKDNFLHGWGLYTVNRKPSYGFSGGNVTGFRKFVENDMTIIFLSNGYKFFDVQDQVINHVAGLVDKNLSDGYSLANEEITTEFLKNDFAKAEQKYVAIRKENPEWNFEIKLNSIGYSLMNNEREKDAIKIFELNAKENPKSGNAFDSLAEGYLTIGQLELSKQNYKISFGLNPENGNAKEMIDKIEKLLEKK
ncbi:serine hydrolase [Flavobacterium sp. ZB4P13]|uniref:serine hydrolase n=1 Tax=Flavobacterium sp. ZB4P13 TaxID=3401728 RepID=UPI003AAFBF73